MKILLQRANKPTADNRIYTKKLLRKIAVDYTEQYVKNNRGLVIDYAPQSVITNLNRVIATVNEIKVVDNNLIADIQPIKIDRNRNIWTLVESGQLECGISGLGTVTQQPNGTYVVNEDYELCNIFINTMKLPSLKYLISEGFINLTSISINKDNSVYLLGMDSTNMKNKFGFEGDYCVTMFPDHMNEEKQLKKDESFCSKYITTLDWENGASEYFK